MNWEVVKQLVEYGRSQEKIHNKNFRFTLTTNGVLLNDEITEFCNREMSNVVLSLDGRKEVNDRMRPTRNGKGSYDVILPKYKEFQQKRKVSIISAEHLPIITWTLPMMWKTSWRKVLMKYLWNLS